MVIKCMILEDEPLALKQMEAYIKKTPFLSLVSSASDPIEGITTYHEVKPDILFIDINMPELNGVDFVKSLKNKCLIIFTTAYSEFALEGYKVDAVDYLLKPIAYSDFLKAANKARELFGLKNNYEEHIIDDNNYLFVKSEYRLVKIKFDNIKYIEGMREYVRIHQTNAPSIMTLQSMKLMEERLPKEKFMRVHRSYIVNLEKVTIIERQRIVFDKNIYIPVGDQYKDTFDNYINKSFL